MCTWYRMIAIKTVRPNLICGPIISTKNAHFSILISALHKASTFLWSDAAIYNQIYMLRGCKWVRKFFARFFCFHFVSRVSRLFVSLLVLILSVATSTAPKKCFGAPKKAKLQSSISSYQLAIRLLTNSQNILELW